MSQANSGMDTMSYYFLEVFTEAKMPLDPHLLSTLQQTVLTFGVLMATPVMARVGRRPHFMFAALLMGTAMVGLALMIQIEVSLSFQIKLRFFFT